ncbi:hypothetical protein M2352_000356 [Azospirillum fermentarium]|uniref:helix-turn-helix domain-containing protein n=1 Tax=Azospirillum fermentarium TaxID=1233114 RepID=UPI0022272423|nr:helix-turn-helix domain-containing protein [Azospirillum fermentarium]MCW2244765.1 hypothetical protein [Azospirillum fermentarium]
MGEITDKAPVVVTSAQTRDAYQDAVITLSVDSTPYRLAIAVKRSIFPRDAREIAWKLKYFSTQSDASPHDTIPVVVAETLSPGARDALRAERVGYFDASGSLFLAAKGLYLRIDRPALKTQSRTLNNLFTGQRAQVLHAVWLTGREWFGVHDIAARAGVSPATASETLTALERRTWVEARGAGPSKERRLTDPRALLDGWAAYQGSVKSKTVRHYYIRTATPADLQRRINRACGIENVPYELAGISAGQIHTPYLSSVSQVFCRIPAGQGMQAVLAGRGKRLCPAGRS